MRVLNCFFYNLGNIFVSVKVLKTPYTFEQMTNRVNGALSHHLLQKFLITESLLVLLKGCQLHIHTRTFECHRTLQHFTRLPLDITSISCYVLIKLVSGSIVYKGNFSFMNSQYTGFLIKCTVSIDLFKRAPKALNFTTGV